MIYLEKAKALRSDPAVHYNCAQAVLIPFAAEMGISEQQANAMGAHFGSGMRHGSTCGAITGALMVLGMLGCDEQQATALLRQLHEEHGALDCTALLRTSYEQGIPRKTHCDGMVFELVESVSAILTKRQ